MIFLDTNIVLRLVDIRAPEHRAVRRTVSDLEARGEMLVIGLQVLVEPWVVATRPAENNGLGWSTEVAHEVLSRIRDRFTALTDTRHTETYWLTLVTERKVLGKRAHDARIAALMKTYDVRRLLTLNPADFAGFDVEILEPLKEVEGD